MKRRPFQLTKVTGPVTLVQGRPDMDGATADVPVQDSTRRFRRGKDKKADVVADVAQRTADAAALAEIAGQELLLDPRTNPAVRDHAIALRNRNHRKAITSASNREDRRLDVEDSRAAYAARALEIIQMAEEKNSPAHSVLALHDGRKKYMTVSVVCSTLLSCGSATGIMALAQKHGAPGATGNLVGAVAELGLTGMSTLAVLYRTHLTSHRSMNSEGSAHRIDGAWQDAGLWFLTVAPLVAAVAANAVAHGAVGVFCSVGAALFSVFSYIVSDRSSKAMRERAAEVKDTDKQALHEIAMSLDAQVIVTAEPVETEPEPAKVTVEPEQDAPADEDDKLNEIAARRKARRELLPPEDTAPKLKPVPDPEPSYQPRKGPQNHPKWEKGVRLYTESVEAGEPLSQHKLTKELGLKNRNLSSLIIAHVRTERAKGQS